MFSKWFIFWCVISSALFCSFGSIQFISKTTRPYLSLNYEYIWEEYQSAQGDIVGDDIIGYGSSFGPFHNYNELTAKLFHLNSSFSQIVDLFSIGKTFFEREIYCVRLTDESIQTPKTEVLFIAQHHAREQITVENALYFLDKIAYESLNGNKTIQHVLERKEIYVIPSLNIDGASLIHKFPWQRKTARPIDADGDGTSDEFDGKNHIFEPSDTNQDGFIECYCQEITSYLWEIVGYEGIDLDLDGKVGEDSIGGVDPNRNYDYGWGNPDFSSDNPNDDSYRGPYPFSENCTASLRDFTLEHDFRIAVSLHSGINELYSPVNVFYDPKEEGDTELYEVVTEQLSDITGYKHRIMPAKRAAGHWLNWMYWKGEESSNIALCFEVFGNQEALTEETDQNTGLITVKGVWDMFNPPANNVIDNCELIYDALLYLSSLSYYDNLNPSVEFNGLFFLIVLLSTIGLISIIVVINKNRIQ